MATIGERNYRGVALSQGLYLHSESALGLGEVAFIEGVSSHQGYEEFHCISSGKVSSLTSTAQVFHQESHCTILVYYCGCHTLPTDYFITGYWRLKRQKFSPGEINIPVCT